MGVKFAIDTASLLYLLGAIVIGGVIGSLWGIERRLNAFGESIQRRVAAPGATSTVAEPRISVKFADRAQFERSSWPGKRTIQLPSPTCWRVAR